MTVADALAVDVPRMNGSADSDLKLNGVPTPIDTDNGAFSSGPDSPAISSPPNNADAPAVKIDLDYAQRESDARHEPLPLSIEKQDDVSTHPQLGSPQDPASIPIAPPNGTPPPPAGRLMNDVMMAERPTPTTVVPEASSDGVKVNGVHLSDTVNGVNGGVTDSYRSGDEDMNIDTPIASTLRSSEGMDAEEPPAKRARKLSDAELASLANSPAPVPPLTPPTTASTQEERSATPSPPKERKATLSQQQFRFCISTVRQLRKLKDASPFLQPVDAVALNIPHYHSIVKHPMDFSAIDRKLAASNPAKPDPNPSNPRYLNSGEFVSDVHTIFSNAVLFNGPEHPVTLMGRRIEAIFDKQIKQLPPPAEEPKPPLPKKIATPSPPPPPVASQKKSVPPRRPSTSVPTIRRSETTETARPKREIHPPPPKDLPYAEAPKKMRSVRKAKMNDGTEEQLKYCAKILTDLHKKSVAHIASHFYFPVDPIAMGIPQYAKMIKEPMDMSTMKKKLDNREYPNAEKFYEDFNLMIRNCMKFNPIGNLVHQAGVDLQRLFEEKWESLPPLKATVSEDEDEDEEEDSEDERRRTIALMESQIETMKGNLAVLKNQTKKQRKEKKEKKREKHVSPPVASSSKANGKLSKPSQKKKSSKKEKLPDDDTLSFDQKKALSEGISQLVGDKQEKVIAIIREGFPEIRENTEEEIILDIDALPAHVLMKLYNFVLRPLRQQVTKRARTGTGTGTGGLKRKSMDEDVEAEKIRQLEERMKLFENKGSVSASAPSRRHNDSDSSSDDSSSDDSVSDSD